MTTVILDIENKKVVSDSLAIETIGGKVVAKYNNTKKVYKSACGKFIASCSGCLILSEKVMRQLGMTVDTQFGYSSNKGNISDVLIMNTYNKQVMQINTVMERNKIKQERKYHSGSTRITMGTGGLTAAEAFDKLKDPLKAVRYSAMKDRGTNDILQVESL